MNVERSDFFLSNEDTEKLVKKDVERLLCRDFGV
jgi:hypothetical protein